jgi:hypothetical protein
VRVVCLGNVSIFLLHNFPVKGGDWEGIVTTVRCNNDMASSWLLVSSVTHTLVLLPRTSWN